VNFQGVVKIGRSPARLVGGSRGAVSGKVGGGKKICLKGGRLLGEAGRQ